MKKQPYPLVNATAGGVVAHEVFMADNFLARLRGLIGRPPLRPGQALWITPCQQVHTHFMRVPLDIIFLDDALVVRRVARNLRPWRFSPWVRAAHSVLELPASESLAVKEGDCLVLARERSQPSPGLPWHHEPGTAITINHHHP